ncbi:unnamed protein product, partial [Porites evermanni]
SSNEIDELLSEIYGPNHNRGHALIDPRRPSTLEARIRRQSSIHTTSSPIRHLSVDDLETFRSYWMRLGNFACPSLNKCVQLGVNLRGSNIPSRWFRKPSKKKRKSTKNEEEQANDLPPITFKGGRKGFNLSESLRGRKGFNLSESLRGYHSFTDEEESEQRRKNDQRGLPNFNRKGSYQRLSGEKDVELVDGMFEDSPEKDRKKSGKKKRRRSKGNDDDVVS